MQLAHLEPTHPGWNDAAYRARRDAIARLALAHRDGAPPPIVSYTQAEHNVWREVRAQLDERMFAREIRDAMQAFALPRARIPQLADVSARLARRSGFRLAPIDGLVAPRRFLAALADGVFLATQYVRHPSRPLYTPEPDVLHELLGHAATLGDTRLAALQRRFGVVARDADEATLRAVERVYWFTIEFGVVLERDAVRAVGAGLLSSVGELERLTTVELRPFDLEAIARTPYATDGFQERPFVAPSFDALVAETEAWLETAQLGQSGAASSRGG